MRSILFIFSTKIWKFCTLFLTLTASDFLRMNVEGGIFGFGEVVSITNTVSTAVDDAKQHVANGVNNAVNTAVDAVKVAENILKNLSDMPVTDTEVVFLYFNKDNTEGVAFNILEFNESKLTGWRQNAGLKVITHGWKESDKSNSVVLISDAYLKNNDFNLIVVNWSGPASDAAYVIAASKTQGVGRIIARLLTNLVNLSLVSWDSIHCIAYGLGGHAMSVAGVNTQGQIGRISGLDTSNLIYDEIPLPDPRVLDPTDAVFVDVMYTAGGELGSNDMSSYGDINFYPNGGRHPQPGCLITEIKCSTGRSYQFFVESIENPVAFAGRKCENWVAYENGDCDNNTIEFMGNSTPTTATGQYYLATNGAPPYGKGNVA